MSEPFFSIMMPAYNAEKYIRQALESIRLQSFDDYELIIFDDCSSDGTPDIIAEFARNDSRIKVFRNSRNLGSCRTRRLALAKMSGRYVAFLDSDDIWDKRKLEVFRQKLQPLTAQAVCVHSDSLIIDAEGNVTGLTFQQRFNADGRPVTGCLFPDIILSNWINMSAAVVNRQALLEIGGFRELSDMVADDWDMWVRFAHKGEFIFIPEALTRYRVHQGGISAPHQVERVAIAREQILDNVLRLYASTLSRKILSRVCYLRAANAVVLGRVWLARKYFFEAWVSNKWNVKALFRTVVGK